MIEPSDEMCMAAYRAGRRWADERGHPQPDDRMLEAATTAMLAIVEREHQAAVDRLVADLRRIASSARESALSTPPECMREHIHHHGRAAGLDRAADIVADVLGGES